jgi:hypothetical protein
MFLLIFPSADESSAFLSDSENHMIGDHATTGCCASNASTFSFVHVVISAVFVHNQRASA